MRARAHTHNRARTPTSAGASPHLWIAPLTRGNRAGFLTGTLLSLPKGPLGATKDGAVCVAFTVAVDGFILPQLQAWWASSPGRISDVALELTVTSLKRPTE